MGSYADYLENKLVGLAFGSVSFSPAATLYVGLSTTTITDAGGNITEPSGNNYSRVSVTNNSSNFNTPSGGATANTNAITFPTASGSWGTVTDFFISDASSGGNIYCYGALSTAQSITTNNTLSIPAGDLDIIQT